MKSPTNISTNADNFKYHSMVQRKKKIENKINYLDESFQNIISSLNSLNIKIMQHLKQIINISDVEQFHKKFATSKSLITFISDMLISFEIYMKDESLSLLLSNTSSTTQIHEIKDESFKNNEKEAALTVDCSYIPQSKVKENEGWSVAVENPAEITCNKMLDVNFDDNLKEENSMTNYNGSLGMEVVDESSVISMPNQSAHNQQADCEGSYYKIVDETLQSDNTVDGLKFDLSRIVPSYTVLRDFKLRKYYFNGDLNNGIIPLAISSWMFYFQDFKLTHDVYKLHYDINFYIDNYKWTKTELKKWVQLLKPGSVVSAQYKGDKKWYRGLIVAVTYPNKKKSASFYEIYFVDYGEFQLVGEKSIHPLPFEFSRLPITAICCVLNNVSPVVEPDVWPPSLNKAFIELSLVKSQMFEKITFHRKCSNGLPLMFVSLFINEGMIMSNHPSPLDFIHYLSNNNALSITDDNKMSIHWFDSYCSGQDRLKSRSCKDFIPSFEFFQSVSCSLEKINYCDLHDKQMKSLSLDNILKEEDNSSLRVRIQSATDDNEDVQLESIQLNDELNFTSVLFDTSVRNFQSIINNENLKEQNVNVATCDQVELKILNDDKSDIVESREGHMGNDGELQASDHFGISLNNEMISNNYNGDRMVNNYDDANLSNKHDGLENIDKNKKYNDEKLSNNYTSDEEKTNCNKIQNNISRVDAQNSNHFDEKVNNKDYGERKNDKMLNNIACMDFQNNYEGLQDNTVNDLKVREYGDDFENWDLDAGNEAEHSKIEVNDLKPSANEVVSVSAYSLKPVNVTNDPLNVFVTYVVSPSLFWINIISNELNDSYNCSNTFNYISTDANICKHDTKSLIYRKNQMGISDELNELNSALKESCDVMLSQGCLTPLPVHQCIRNTPCLLLLDAAEDNIYCRGEILEVLKDECDQIEKIKLFLVDLGEEFEMTSLDNLFLLDQYFIDHSPKLAICCKLGGIEPVDKMEWSNEALSYFFSKIENSNLGAYFFPTYKLNDVVYGTIENPLIVELFHVDDNSTTPYISVQMFDKKFAQLIEEIDEKFNEFPSENHSMNKWELSNRELSRFFQDELTYEYLSYRNSYMVDTDDPGVATVNYKARDEERICKFFNMRDGCWWGEHCRYEHTRANPLSVTTDTQLVYDADNINDIILDDGGWYYVNVSVIISPQQFYVVLPYGADLPVEEVSCDCKSPLEELMENLNSCYNGKIFPDHDLTLYALGEFVVARSVNFELWHRATVLNHYEEDDDDLYLVYYVDYGNMETIPSTRIRDIEPQFVQLPHQAIQSFLPLVPNNSTHWSPEAIEFFTSLVTEKYFLARIIKKYHNPPYEMMLYDLNDSSKNGDVCDLMVRAGHAMHPEKFSLNTSTSSTWEVACTSSLTSFTPLPG